FCKPFHPRQCLKSLEPASRWEPPNRLTDFENQINFDFAWSRDGKQIAFSRGVINSDVVLISNFR
ncbi:MAG: PD40 domain-containing protein, partial [Chloracidobacterium sp.]|nr:PD40 domain-containing protein [Chloracidobacterium sp.]